jgi:UDP-2,3-diacylglucosamine pyrophosphatase LpxH
MRTAIVSDLHLGAASGEDVARDATVRWAMLEEVATADRVVLLGDVVELRDLPLGAALERARPFFEELGEALGERDVVLVPGNHDHRLAEPLLDSLSLAGGSSLGLQQRHGPSPGPTEQIDRWLGGARLEIAYPGVWLRDDVYASHGHYMDCHLSIPRAECVAAAAMLRGAGLPDPAQPRDYEQILRPLYGFSFGVAQSGSTRLVGGAARPSEAAWKLIAGDGKPAGRGRRAASAAVRAGIPAAVWSVNRLLRSSFKPDLSSAAISAAGVSAAAETARRLRVEAEHVITGHTHRAGPADDEQPWRIPGGGLLHNTGSWVFADAFHHPGSPPGPYWPGVVTWVEDSGPPQRVRLLEGHPRDGLVDAVSSIRATRR